MGGASREFPGGPVLRIPGFHSHGLGSIPDPGTESLKPSGTARKKKKAVGTKQRQTTRTYYIALEVTQYKQKANHSRALPKLDSQFIKKSA